MEILMKKISAKTNMLACGTDVYLAAIIIVHALHGTVPWYLWTLFGLEAACALVIAVTFYIRNGESIAS